MNLKQLGILILVVIVIGGAGLVLHNHQKADWVGGGAEVGKKLLGDFPINDVAHIQVKHGSNEMNLVKKDDFWRVRERGDYPANFSQISEFILKARDLKIIQVEEIGPSQLARMELLQGQGSNSATVVEFKDQSDKTLRTLFLGKRHLKKSPAPSQGEGDEGVPDGRYVEVGTNLQTVSLISDPLENVDAVPDQWVNKDFFKVEKAKAIEVNFSAATNSWKLTRETETGDWKLSNTNAGEELDSSKATGVASAFSAPSFTGVFPGAKLDESGTNKPTVVKIETFDNFNYTINVGAKTNDDYLVTMAVAAEFPKERVVGKDEKGDEKLKLDAEFKVGQQKLADKLKQEQDYGKWTYLVPSWVVDAALKQRSELLTEKKVEAKPATDASEKTGDTKEMPPIQPLPGN